MDSKIESFINSLIKVNKYSDLQRRAARIHACLEVLSARSAGEPDPVILDDIESFSHQLNSINKALDGEDIQVKYMKDEHSQLWNMMEDVFTPYLRKHNLSAVQIEMTLHFLNHSTIKDVCEKMFTSERNVGYHRNEITKKMEKNTFQEVISDLWSMFAKSFTCE